MRRLLVGVLSLALLASFASCSSSPSCNPCNAPAPEPDNGCQSYSKPCVCWPDYGSPTARWMVDEIVASCNWHIANTPSQPGWIQLRNKANWIRNHQCTKYTCGELYQLLQVCHAAVVAIGYEPAPAPACTELNHPD